MVRLTVPFALAMALAAAGQTAPPEFVAASVKPSPPGAEYGGMRGGPGTSSPGQIEYSATTLRAVTSRAYGLQRFQIVGPAWFDQQRYDIVAKIPPGTTAPQFQLMLQGLLADRFRMQCHKENRTASISELTVAKSGLKMRESSPQNVGPPEPGATAPPVGARWTQGFSDGKIEVMANRVSMRQIIVWLSDQTGREIVDKTGLTGTYDVAISWTRQGGTGPDDISVGNTIESALEKYLGLKLVSRKEPVEMLVIDRLERMPTEN